MVSERAVHSYVGYHTFAVPEDEADAVAENIVIHNKQGVRWDEQAVLMRMNFMTRAIEMALALPLDRHPGLGEASSSSRFGASSRGGGLPRGSRTRLIELRAILLFNGHSCSGKRWGRELEAA